MTLHQRRQRYSWVLAFTLLTACGIYDPTFEYAGLRLQSLSTQEIQQVKDSGLVDANNRFAFKLFDEIAKQSSQSNLMISPASASLALFMTYHAASPEAASEMAKVLEIQNMNQDSLMQSSELLMRKLRKPAEGITLEISNSIWADKSNSDIHIPEDYIEKMKQHYLSYVGLEDFSDSNFLNKVNQKAAQDTHGKIPEVLSKLPPQNTFMILSNAIYFKANWKQQFETNETHDREFHLSDGSTKTVKMMRQFNNNLAYFVPQSSSSVQHFPFRAAFLPYGKDNKVQMALFLPNPDKSLKDIYEIIKDPSNLELMQKNVSSAEGSIILPKFSLNSEQDLIPVLKSLGMNRIFDPQAKNFPTFSAQEALLGQVQQKSFIEVNEEGTEAAAWTFEFPSMATSAPPPEMKIIFDKPFFYMIRDNETGQILFMGQVTDPIQ